MAAGFLTFYAPYALCPKPRTLVPPQAARLRGSVVWRLKESMILTDKHELKRTSADNAKCAPPHAPPRAGLRA